MEPELAAVQSAEEAVRAFCAARIPGDLKDEIRLEVTRRGRSITLHEQRPPWDPERMGPEWTSMAIARLRYDPSSRSWSLYYRDSSDRWWEYEGIGPTASVEPLLAELDRDPTGIFWG